MRPRLSKIRFFAIRGFVFRVRFRLVVLSSSGFRDQAFSIGTSFRLPG